MIIPPVCMLAFTIAMGVLLRRGGIYFHEYRNDDHHDYFFCTEVYFGHKRYQAGNKERELMYGNYLLDVRKRIIKARKEEKKALEYQNPTLPELEHMINRYSSRIYERSLLDDDF